MEDHNGYVNIPAKDLCLIKAQLEQFSIKVHNHDQNHAREISDLRTQHQQIFQQQAEVIRQFEAQQYNRPTKRHQKPDAFRAEPRKFTGYGDNAELWFSELESNF